MFIDYSAPRAPYFLQIQEALRRADIASPILVLDLQRFDANLTFLRSDVPRELALRLVSKSLPCVPLLRHAREALGTDRLMTFNLPMLIDLARAMPGAHQLLGKPLPVAAARQLYREGVPSEPVEKVTWLVDTPRRLAEYGDLAQELDRTLSVALELDVGLHRGGFEVGPRLADALTTLRDHNGLRFGGFMGYEAHLSKVPTLLGWRDRQVASVQAVYRDANRMAREILGEEGLEGSVRNGAGSPTYRFYRGTDVIDEVAVGSALVKPTDFETDLLKPFQPALFVATPALKVLDRTQIPVLEALDRVKGWLDPNLARTVFIHGGFWKAEPVDPPGLRINGTYGRSTNQEMLNLGRRTEIEPDDRVFLRPTQSEAVMLQFGHVAVYQDGEISEVWPTLPPSA